MDKRSLIFVLALTVSLFFVHQWFNSKDEARKKQRIEQTPLVQETTSQAPISQAEPSPSFSGEPLSREEKFYVLENEYQQLVFSNFGGNIRLAQRW